MADFKPVNSATVGLGGYGGTYLNFFNKDVEKGTNAAKLAYAMSSDLSRHQKVCDELRGLRQDLAEVDQIQIHQLHALDPTLEEAAIDSETDEQTSVLHAGPVGAWVRGEELAKLGDPSRRLPVHREASAAEVRLDDAEQHEELGFQTARKWLSKQAQHLRSRSLDVRRVNLALGNLAIVAGQEHVHVAEKLGDAGKAAGLEPGGR